ncbi:glycolate oxidase subunit GlcD [Elusimicrobium simillimum]|uniref:FAD-binding oxidoreductase n=1 Tax=Elusimicrobium simillimum TaxID=3143438 RepID=UPI003C6ED807
MFVKDTFSKIKAGVIGLLGADNVFTDEITLALHSFDCSLDRTMPEAVLRITDTAAVAPLIKILNANQVPFVVRASATNHVGGCVALKGGVVLNMMPLNKILKIDTLNKTVEVECCVVNADLHAALEPLGYTYLPDPASQKICTIGGNAALNAGGAKGVKYGATREHISQIEFVTPQGEVLILSANDAGPDLLGFIIGSEGTLGVITKLWLKIEKQTPFIKTMLAAFNTIDDSIAAVAAITASGIVPRCVEAMDKLTIETVEAYSKSGYPTDCEALLLIETDGDQKKAEREMKEIEDICKKHKAFKTETAKDEAHRQALWRGRSGGYAAMARLAQNVFVEDGTVPRAALPQAIKKTREICDNYGITAGLFFHAGDGNLHPNIVFDERNQYETGFVVKAGKEMLRAVTDLGGTISGEHGVGIEKRAAMAYMYGEAEINLFKTLKAVFDPKNISNPDKVFPVVINNPRVPQLSGNVKELSAKIAKADKAVITGLNTNKTKSKLPKIELKNFNKILDIDKENYTLTVEAGAAVDMVRKNLAEHNLYAALPKYKGSIGGLLAQGLSNEFTASVTGIEAVLANGGVVNYGGKFVKNSAGYNLARLFAGSRGQYGVITKLIIRLFKEEKPAALAQKTAVSNLYISKIKTAIDPDAKFAAQEEEQKNA